MKLAIIHPLPLLDASLDSTSLTWLIISFVVVIVLLVIGVLATAPARRRERAAALASAAPALVEAAPTPAPAVAAPPSSAPEPDFATSSPSSPVMPAPVPASMPAPIQPATPAQSIASSPAMTDFSASGPIILPSSVVEASFGPVAPPASPSASGSWPSPAATGASSAPAPAPAPAPASASVSGPLMPSSSNEPAPAVVGSAPIPSLAAMPASASAPASANGSASTLHASDAAALDLFAHAYGRTNAAMLSATERAAARRIARALHDDPLAVQLAALFAAETHHPLDGLAQFLETDRRNRTWHESEEKPVLSDAAALDLFAHAYGRTNAAMLSATERAAAGRIVHTLGADPLAVRLAALYAAETQRPLDGLAGQLETDLLQPGARNNHQESGAQERHGNGSAAGSTPDMLDLFARAYGRYDAAMLSATERGDAARIIQALNGDSAAVREAVDFAIISHQSLDSLAGRLESERRSGPILHG